MILTINDLHVTYNMSDAKTNAVRGVSFALRDNSFCGLIGESGSGKSTIIMTILGLLPDGTDTDGEIYYSGQNIIGLNEDKMNAIRQREIALIPQGAMNSFTPVMTVGAHIREVLELHCSMTGKEAKIRTEALLSDVGLPPGTADRYPHELSGGQKQRAAIALALSCGPRLILADEPTTALDVITQASIMRLLEDLRRKKGLTILLVTHDLPLAASVCDELFVMKDGSIIEHGTPREIVDSPREEHTKALIAAML